MIKRFKKIILSSGLPDKEMAAMELGLAHYLSRYKVSDCIFIFLPFVNTS